MGRLDGKVAIISGGARGQGATEARMFAKEGAKIVIGDLLNAEGQAVAAEIAELGGDCTYVHLDVTSEDDWRAAVETAVSEYGKVDVLINNAGILMNGRVEDTTVEAWDAVLDVNAKGVFLGTRAVIEEMRKAGGGSIINISSVAGMIGSPNTTAYNASKGAVRLLTKSTAIQYGRENIRCNSIHPGPIDTDMIQLVWQDPSRSREETIARTPLGRIGTVEDITYGAMFLASDESSFMTGSELVMDGGVTAI
jgi:cyclopentanol dehydrogenase